MLNTTPLPFPAYRWRWLFAVLLTGSLSITAFAGGVRGTITATDGEPLPFASVYVAETGSGATSDRKSVV
jgi:hypothetical protein